MQHGDYKSAMELFERASSLHPAERRAFLDASGAPAQVVRRVVAMLDADAAESDDRGGGMGIVAQLVQEDSQEHAIRSVLPELRGHYRIIRLLGEGGSGAVYEAEQTSPRRAVALKALRPGRTSHRALRRLEFEAQVLARLQHPAIAQVFEAGVADSEHPDQAFIAMELVRGVSLTAHARLKKLGLSERLNLFLEICAGVAHAHQRGIIHRDLKPANILVDEAGRPRILDFGVARVTDESFGIDASITQQGQIVGTLQYMSPEQAWGDPSAIDTRSDVYALGAILFELLTDRVPLELDGLPLAAALDRVRSDRPPLAGDLCPELRGDIETIIARAMDADRDRRYSSVTSLSDDIRNHLEGRPIEARRDSLSYVAFRVANRHRKSLGVAILALLALITFGVVSSVQSRENARLAESESLAHREVRIALEERTREKERADSTSESLRRSLSLSNIAVAHAAVFAGDRRGVRRALDACPDDLRAWEWSYLRRYIERSSTEVVAFAQGQLGLDSVGAGSLVVVSHGTAGLAVVDSALGTVVERSEHDGFIVAVAGARNGAVAIGDVRGLVTVKQSVSGAVAATIQSGVGHPRGLLFSDDATRLTVVGQTGVVEDWSIPSGEMIAAWRVPYEGMTLAISGPPQSDRLYLAGTYGVARLDRSSDAFEHLLTTDASVLSVDVDRDERFLAIGDDVRTVSVYQLNDMRSVFLYRGHGSRVIAVRLSPDGSHLATGSGDSTVRYFNISTGDEIERFLAHEATVTGLTFLGPDRLVSAGRDGFVRTWALSINARATSARWKRTDIAHLLPTHDGLFIAGEGPAFAKIDAESGVALWSDNSASHGLRLFETDRTVIGLTNDGRVTAWMAGEPVWSVDVGETAKGGLLRDHLLSITVDHRLITVDAASGRIVESIDFGDETPVGIAAGGDWRLVTCVSGRLMVVRNGRIDRVFDGHPDGAWCAATHPDGTLVATSGEDGVIRLWDPRDWSVAGTMGGDQLAILGLEFSPDGSRLATAGFDTTVRLWSLAERAEVLRLSGHVWAVQSVAFDAVSGSLYSGAADGVIRRWRVQDRWSWNATDVSPQSAP
ncbi:MAG: protein kinase [Phycisphaeraceae bacterium]|nr:protein kinase [Phycisphaeraceae bacterium]